MDEVLGMLSFANDIVTHLSQVEVILKKEKKKRLRREQLQTDADKLEVNIINYVLCLYVYKYIYYITLGSYTSN